MHDIAEQLPAWLRGAGPKPLALLRACMTAHFSGRRTWVPGIPRRMRVSPTISTRGWIPWVRKRKPGSGEYVHRCEQLKRETEQAFEALGLQLTEQELNLPLQGQPHQGV